MEPSFSPSPLEPEGGFRNQRDSSPWSIEASSVPGPSSHNEQEPFSPTRESNGISSPDRKVGALTPRSPQAERNERSRSQDGLGGRIGIPNSGEIVTKSFVRIRVVALEKNRRDIYVKFNAESNLPNYRSANYRAVSRSYNEFLKLVEALSANNPQSIIPALPLSQTSAMTDEEDDRLIKSNFQKWFGRILGDAAVVKDEELRGFIESDFGYTPSTKLRRKTPSTFHFPRGMRPADQQDDTLTLSKAATSHLEINFNEAAKIVEKLAKARRAAGVGYDDVGEKMASFAATEVYGPLANGWKKLARTTKIMGDLQGAMATGEQVTLGDSLSYQATNSRAAKDTLVSRDVILNEHRGAVKSTRAKRDVIERLKNSSSIKADRVDEALDELEEAKKYEALLAQRLQNISETLQPSLQTHSQNAHEDILTSLLEHAKSSILYEKQLLKELELLRPELQAIREPRTVSNHYQSPVSRNGSLPSSPLLPSSITSPPRNSNSMSRGTSDQSGPLFSSPINQIGRFENGASKSMMVGNSGPLGGESINSLQSNNTGRRTINSMAKSAVIGTDPRQRADHKMAASMLANGF